MSAPTKPSDPKKDKEKEREKAKEGEDVASPVAAASSGGKLMLVLIVLSSANVGATGFVVTRVLKAPRAEMARVEPPKKHAPKPVVEKGDGGDDQDDPAKTDGGKGGDEEAAAPAAEEKKDAAPGPTVALEAFLVNLNEAGSGRYLKTAVEVELADSGAVDEMNKQKRSIRDDLLRYLSSLTVGDTLGEPAKDKIKLAMITRIGKQIGGKDRVRRIFLTDFMVQ